VPAVSGNDLFFIVNYLKNKHAAGGAVVEALRYKPKGRGFDFPLVSVDFFIEIIFPVALWHQSGLLWFLILNYITNAPTRFDIFACNY
jgi:hypothetical protein